MPRLAVRERFDLLQPLFAILRHHHLPEYFAGAGGLLRRPNVFRLRGFAARLHSRVWIW